MSSLFLQLVLPVGGATTAATTVPALTGPTAIHSRGTAPADQDGKVRSGGSDPLFAHVNSRSYREVVKLKIC
jgi:hypothetical protein